MLRQEFTVGKLGQKSGRVVFEVKQLLDGLLDRFKKPHLFELAQLPILEKIGLELGVVEQLFGEYKINFFLLYL